jgi:hypothetical protein
LEFGILEGFVKNLDQTLRIGLNGIFLNQGTGIGYLGRIKANNVCDLATNQTTTQNNKNKL